MQITLDTAESSIDELTALIALLASLGGRLPSVTNNVVVTVDAAPARTAIDSVQAGNEGLTVTNGAGTPAVSNGGTTTSNAPAATDVDSKGTPWDARIHSESKATVADGTWRKRRGVSDDVFNEVMAELTADIAPPPPADDQDNEVPLDEQVPAPPAPTGDAPTAPEPAASAPVAGDPPAGGGQFSSFAEFVAAVSKHGKTYAELNEMAGIVGVPMFKDLKDHADKWDMFFAMI